LGVIIIGYSLFYFTLLFLKLMVKVVAREVDDDDDDDGAVTRNYK